MRRLIQLIICSLFISACGGGSNDSPATTSNAATDMQFESIAITSSIDTIPTGFSGKLDAIGYLSDGSSEVITDAVNWNSSVNAVASITSVPYVKGLSAGTTQVHASYQGLQSNMLSLSVNNDTLTDIQLTPAQMDVPLSTGFQYKAMGTFTDGSVIDINPDVNWNVSTSASNQGQSISTQDTSSYRNNINNTDIVLINSDGQVTTKSTGNLKITATVGEVISNSSEVTVKEVKLIELQITPNNPDIAIGTNQAFHAIGFFDDNSTFDLTKQVFWASSQQAITAITDQGYLSAVSAGQSAISANWGNVTASANVNISDKSLVSIQVTPEKETLSVCSSEPFNAIGTFSDKSSQDITELVTWKSSDMDVASVSQQGLVVAKAIGNTNITASLIGVTGSAEMTVDTTQLVSIQITPGVQTMWGKAKTAFYATGFYSDGSAHDITQTVYWRSLNTSVVTILKGTALAKDSGETTIVAQKLGVTSNEVKVTVNTGQLESIHLTPSAIVVPINATEQLHADGHYSDGLNHEITETVAWRSSAPNVATVSVDGHIVAIGQGNAEISAYKQGIISNVMSVSITASQLESLQITSSADSFSLSVDGNASGEDDAEKNIAIGVAEKFYAVGHYSDNSDHDVTSRVTWLSSDPNVARVLANGRTIGIHGGTTNIQAVLDGIGSNAINLNVVDTQLVKIQLSPTVKEMNVGVKAQFDAIGHYSDGDSHEINQTASWVSSNPSVATVSKTGEVTAHNEGQANILTWKNGVSSSEAIVNVKTSVLNSIQLSPALKQLTVGSEIQLTAQATYANNEVHDITLDSAWRSSNTNVATVTPDGIVHTKALGEVDITGRQGSILSNSAKISVISGSLSDIILNLSVLNLNVGTNAQLHADGLYANDYHQDISRDASWRSEDANIATVTREGKVTAVSAGTTNIKVRLGNIEKTLPVTVSRGNIDAITLSFTESDLILNHSLTVQATASFDTGISVNNGDFFDWQASTQGIVNITDGRITAIGTGTTNITAHRGETQSDALVLTVINANLQSINLVPATQILSKENHYQYQAQGIYQDSNGNEISADVSYFASWNSSDNVKATVSNNGYVQTLNTGDVTITASIGNISSNSANLTVSNAELTAIRIVNKAGTDDLSRFSYRRLHAEGIFSDGAVENIGDKVLWSKNHYVSIHSQILTGLFKAEYIGLAIVEIRLNNFTASKSINVVAEASLNCATPKMTVQIADESLQNIEYHCPKTTSEVSDEQAYHIFLGSLFGPYMQKFAEYNEANTLAHCQSRGLTLPRAGQIRGLLTRLGIPHHKAEWLNYDYGWPIDNAIGTSDTYGNRGKWALRGTNMSQLTFYAPGIFRVPYCIKVLP